MSFFAKHGTPEPASSRAVTAFPWDSAPAETQSGEQVTPTTAMQLAAVWRCVTLVSELLSSMPVDLYRGSDSAAKVEVEKPTSVILRPSLRVTRREWVYQYVSSMMLRGNAYGVVLAHSSMGLPDVVEWVDPSSVSIYCPSSLALPEYYIDGVKIDRDNVVHLRNVLLPGCVEGLSPIEYHAETIGLGLAARKFGSQWFGQGAHPSAILSTEQRITPTQAEEMKKGFIASIRKRREPAILGAGIKYTPIQVSANESQFLATQAMSATEIALVFGVPAEMLGASVPGTTNSKTYANREQMWQDFVSTCLAHYAGRLEESWSQMTPGGQIVKFNFDALLRGDTETRYRANAIGLTNGFLKLNEVRDIEDMPALPELPEAEPEVEAALNLAEKAPSLVQNPGLPALVDQLRVLNGKKPLNPPPAPPKDDAGATPQGDAA